MMPSDAVLPPGDAPGSALDLAFVNLLQSVQPSTDALHANLAGLLSAEFTQGNVCLDLDRLPAPWRAAAQTLPWAQGDNSPLVLSDSRLYLRRSWQAEQVILSSLRQRLAVTHQAPDTLAQSLQVLFAQTPDAGQPNWQQLACALACRAGVTLITGGPGTGKTTTVVRLLALLQSQALQQGKPLRMALAAPTGKAAARLADSVTSAWGQLPPAFQVPLPVQAHTLHRLLGWQGRAQAAPAASLALDVLVVDEASMIDLELMARLMQGVPLSARLILLGDKDQLASVEAGAVMAQLCEGAHLGAYTASTQAWLAKAAGIDLGTWRATGVPQTPAQPSALAQQTVMLRHSRRFGAESEIGRWAAALNTADQSELQRLWQALPDASAPTKASVARLDGAAVRSSALDDWVRQAWKPLLQALQTLGQTPCSDALARELLDSLGRFQVLCALRQGPWGVQELNQRVAHALGFAPSGWYPGRPVMLSRNDYALNLMNGDTGLCLMREDGLRVAFAHGDKGVRWLAPSRLESAETVFAMTVHKAQGSQFGHVALVLPEQPMPLITRELVYTAITRASDKLTWVGGDLGVLLRAAQHPVQRSGGLHVIHRDAPR